MIRTVVLILIIISVHSLNIRIAIAEEATLLVEWGDIEVTSEDIRRYVAYHLPEQDVEEVLSQSEKMNQFMLNLLMLRKMSALAEEQGHLTDKSQIAWQLEYQKDRWATEALQREMRQEAHEGDSWEAYARETYIAEPEKFTTEPQVDAAHILVRIEEGKEKDAELLVQKLYRQLQEGDDFAELALEYSADTATAARGGELGVFEAGRMVPTFSNAAFALEEPGDISEPVKTRFGYHIIKLNKKIPGEKLPFDRVKAKLVDDLKKRAATQRINNLLATLRTEALDADYQMEAINAFRVQHGLKPVNLEVLRTETQVGQ